MPAFKTFVFASLTACAAALSPTTASAILVTLDHPALSVARPESGSVLVDFYGHIGSLTDGYAFDGYSAETLWTASGETLGNAAPQFNLDVRDGILFSVLVGSTDALGLYAFNFTGVQPAAIIYYECPTTSGSCLGSTVTYSLNVTSPIPEPESLTLMALGLIGIATRLGRRRSARLQGR